MILIFYNIISFALLVVGWPWFVYRIYTGKETFTALMQKFGSYNIKRPLEGGIWIHAVSVGETVTAIPLIEFLLAENPEQNIIFSASTATGMEIARKRLEGKTSFIFFPYDFAFSAQAALSFVRPSVFIFMETEMWPNFLHNCRRLGIRTILVNGRISDGSFRKYMMFRRLAGPMVRNIDLLLMQSQEDAHKIIELGAEKETVKITGNLKFDRPLPDRMEKENIRNGFNIPLNAPAVIFASTHPGEDELFLAIFLKLKKDFPHLFAVLAPRHPERRDHISRLCKKVGLDFALRSKGGEAGELLVLDTIGELGTLYGGMDIAVMGGSFIPHGGQNPLEPAAWKLPVLFGPYMQNFGRISNILAKKGGGISVRDSKELAERLKGLLKNRSARESAGMAAFEVILENQGALKRTYGEIMAVVHDTV